MRNWSQNYQRLDVASLVKPEGAEVWLSPAVIDPCWDDFLRTTPCGQFQQSSLWAEYKAMDCWNSHRVIVTGKSNIVGGFQVLWKKNRLGRIGYVSKGPVAHPESAELIRQLAALLKSAARDLGLIALIVQQPDETQITLPTEGETGLIQSNPMNVVEATYLVDLHEDMNTLRAKMSTSLRRNLRLARKQPGKVREGTEADLPLFFELMAATCGRQNTRPNPSSLAAIQRLWSVFAPSQSIRLTIAECGTATPAAKLSLIFGQLVTVWKKGWDGTHGTWHPNELLEDEALEWSRARGYRACDFCSFNRSAADRIIQGNPVPGSELSSRDEYHVRFGGRPKLLPRSLILLPNTVLSWIYRNGYARFEHFQEQRKLATSARSALQPAV